MAKKSSNKLKIALLAGLSLLTVMAAASALYFFVLRQPTTTEVYRDAVKNALMTKVDDAYLSFDIQSDGFSVNGQGTADINGDNSMMQMDFDAEADNGGVLMDIKGEIIGTKTGDDEYSYMRYKSVTTKNIEYKEMLEAYFKPVINKWVKNKLDKNDNTPDNFEGEGPTALMTAFGLFLPIQKYTEEQQDTYMKMVDKYNLYKVSEKFEKTTFKGVDARKLRVDVQKDAFTEFDKEIAAALNDEEKYEKTDSTFIDQLFGVGEQLTATVYLDPKDSVIIGIELSVELEEKVINKTFGSEFDSVTGSAFVEYDRKFSVDAPKKFLTQKQFEALLAQ